MHFERIAIIGGQADAPDPRVQPVDGTSSAILRTPNGLPGLGTAPKTLVMGLEGTTGETCLVQLYAIDDGRRPGDAEAPFQFYVFSEPLLITVGELISGPALLGSVFYRITDAPAHDATLKLGYL